MHQIKKGNPGYYLGDKKEGWLFLKEIGLKIKYY